ncbi:MAG TPA: hypothetical protein VHO01_01045 [Jatrophihabitans sp.]|nr:hypothetical protein [Jatrophihabitans sp.]
MAIAIVMLLLLAAGLAALGTAEPSVGRKLSPSLIHHVAVPSPVRSLTAGHDARAADVAVLDATVVLGLISLVLVSRRPRRHRLATTSVARRPARGPPAPR